MEPSHQVYGEDDRGHPTWLRVVSGCVCVLSVLGSAAIILSYALIKNMRSKARELLVHISAMDLLYTTANLVGLALPYKEHLIHENNGSSASEYKLYHYICLTQAFVAIYGTVGSILWTIGLAVYLYYRMIVINDHITKKVLAVLYVVCYGIPLYVCLWLLFTHGLGYSPDVSSGAGWCSLNTANTNDGEHSVLLLIMTYDMWIILGIMLLLPLYLSIYAEARHQEKRNVYSFMQPAKSLNTDNRPERKLLFILVIFLFLRIWDLVNDVIFLSHPDAKIRHHKWLLLLTAIGDSGQGFANFIIFFLFQQRLRYIVKRCLSCGYCCHKRRWFLNIHKTTTDDLADFSTSTLDHHSRSS